MPFDFREEMSCSSASRSSRSCTSRKLSSKSVMLAVMLSTEEKRKSLISLLAHVFGRRLELLGPLLTLRERVLEFC